MSRADMGAWQKLTVGFAGMVALASLLGSALSVQAAGSPNFKVNNEPIERELGVNSYAPIVEKAAKSVVNIRSEQVLEQSPMSPLFDDPFFRRFFGDRFDDMPQQRKQRALGSGVIVTEEGYILTNNHVVSDADEITVTLANSEKEYTAEIVGTDPATDLAVIKIDASGLPAMTITDSQNLKRGDVVLAIGNPFGLEQTVTQGIVSAVGRSFNSRMFTYENFIQTDASINPGNSGGALIDTKGRLVGLNTFILSQSGGSAGVGFAVPTEMARNVTEQIIRSGSVERGYLGVLLQPLTQGLAERFGLDSTQGALIASVEPDTPAEEAGIEAGDVIVRFNGEPVEDVRDLQFVVAQTPPGSEASVTVVRDGKEKELTVELGTRPSELAQGRRQDQSEGAAGRVLKGVELTDLTSRFREELNIPSRIEGALVRNVDPQSPAYEAELRPGDVILSINKKKVSSAEEAIELSRQVEEGPVLLYVLKRGGVMRYLVVEPRQNE